MKNGTPCYLGLDVHKATITVAVGEESGQPALDGTIANDPGAVRKLVRKAKLVAAYEAGPTGYPCTGSSPSWASTAWWERRR